LSKKATIFTGVYKDLNACSFYKNDSFIGQINKKQFVEAFFDYLVCGEKKQANQP